MLSNKPYLIRAFYDWIVDSDCTPLIAVNANYPNCQVPQEYVENGEIVLNASPDAIRDVEMGNDFIEFKASFSSIVHLVSFPVKAVLAIYAEENGQGMYFDYEDEDEAEQNEMISQSTLKSIKKPSHLKLVE